MYGLIFTTLQSLIVNKICNGNDDKWKEICMKAGINRVEFYNNEYYDENFLDRIVKAATDILGIELEAALEAFGNEFFEKTKASGHSHMLRTLGSNLFGFLVNLDSLHSHLSFTYHEMQAPSFQCEITEEGLQLHYYSHRLGLYPVVTGIVRAVAKDFFSLEIDIKKNLEEKLSGVKLCYHYGFEIIVKECSRDETYLERLQGEKNVSYVPAFLQFPNSARNSTNLSVLLDPNSEAFLKATSNHPSPFTTGNSLGIESSLNFTNSKEGDIEEVDEGGSSDIDGPEDEPVATLKVTTSKEEDKHIDVAAISYRHILPSTFGRNSPVVSRSVSRRASIFIPTDDWPITITTFRSCFPFHVIFDSNFVITFMGVSMNRLFPNAIAQQKKFSDLFEIERPAIPETTYNHVKSRAHNQFVLKAIKTARTTDSAPLLFRGQMVPISQRSPFSPILFLGSPRVKDIDELKKHGLYLSDIPIHDVTREMILLHHQLEAEMSYVTELERMRHLLEEEQARVKHEKERADQLLHAMLPELVARELKEGKGAQATFYPEVTILFSDIEGFTTICNKCHPLQVVKMLNELYTKFDSHIDECGVYKVETIGDAYMVAAGLLETSKNHAFAVTKFSFLMREAAQSIKRPTDDTPLRIRIGVHTGAVMAGVVGMKMPRYCLFGDTVNLASRMESHGEPGKIHISENTYRLLQDQAIKFICRGKIKVKGLERKQMTYYVEPLMEGEESVTVYLHSDGTDSTDGALSNASITLPAGRLTSESFSENGSNISSQKGRSLSLATNASFSLITSPLALSDQSSTTHRSSLAQGTSPKKSSISSDASNTRIATVPVIEERTESPSEASSRTNLSTGTATRRNQVSPYDPELSGAMQNSDLSTFKTKHEHSKRKCTIS